MSLKSISPVVFSQRKSICPLLFLYEKGICPSPVWTKNASLCKCECTGWHVGYSKEEILCHLKLFSQWFIGFVLLYKKMIRHIAFYAKNVFARQIIVRKKNIAPLLQ